MAGEKVRWGAVVSGTGFGGAVASCRLAQANKRVCILERGSRYLLNDFPRPAKRPDNLPQTSRWFWTLDQGLWDLRDLQGMLAAAAARYGGGVFAVQYQLEPARHRVSGAGAHRHGENHRCPLRRKAERGGPMLGVRLRQSPC